MNKKKPFAKKSLGQNFLIDQHYIDQIISALNPQPDETIIEIGPGRGAITEKLVESRANIIAIELDRELVPLLKIEFQDHKNFQVIEDDALQIDFSTFQIKNGKKLKLVANLPYYISTAILQRLIEQRKSFSEYILMLQREVVDRITARIGNSERGFLTVLVEGYCETEKLFDVPPEAFRPCPKVWSSVVRLKVREQQMIENEQSFRDLVSLGFVQKRKTIFNNLKSKYPNAGEILEDSSIEPTRRAETLTIDEWVKLVSRI